MTRENVLRNAELAASGRDPYLHDLLVEVRSFVARFLVVGKAELDTIALWIAHTYVYDAAPSTPYLNAHSPDPGSGKTTLLEVLSVLAREAIQADNLSESVMFRLIDLKHPTLLLDEIDAVFNKRNSDSSEGIRQLLNSGYRKGKTAWRCQPPTHEPREYNVYCPKATAGLGELPGTLKDRSIGIALKPPLPTDVYEDFDPDDPGVVADGERLRCSLLAWAEEAGWSLRDPALKPARLDVLDARGNQIWQILFRIADLASFGWPECAHRAAGELSGRNRQQAVRSAGVKLLGHIRERFVEEKITCADLVTALNGDDELPYGGWNDGKGITTRELGRKLRPYGVAAKTIRVKGFPKGYDRDQFADAWDRYLPASDPSNLHSSTTRMVEGKTNEPKPPHDGRVEVSETDAIPHQQPDVEVVEVESAEPGDGRPLLGDDGYLDHVAAVHGNGHLTTTEALKLKALHTLVSGAP